MMVIRLAILAFLVCGIVRGADPSAPTPISTNPDDAPARVKSGKVFASTDSSLPPALGPPHAKVLVVVFSDFQCPVCRRSADATQQLAEEFPGEVRVEFWQRALAMHASAETAAIASLAAQRQGKFWEYHDELFRNQSALDPASLAAYAEGLGLDAARFQSDCADPALRERVKSEVAVAERFGAQSTPSFMINGTLKVGWGSWAGFRGDVVRELGEARKLEAQGTPIEQIASLRAQAHIADPEQLKAYRDLVLRVVPEPERKSDNKKTKKRKG